MASSILGSLVASAPNTYAAPFDGCLNPDAAALARLMSYEDEVAISEDTKVPEGNKLPKEISAEKNDLRALTPYQISTKRLLDWTAWPTLKVRLSDKTYSFMGVHITPKRFSQKPPA